jgi:hypothetical protein
MFSYPIAGLTGAYSSPLQLRKYIGLQSMCWDMKSEVNKYVLESLLTAEDFNYKFTPHSRQ